LEEYLIGITGLVLLEMSWRSALDLLRGRGRKETKKEQSKEERIQHFFNYFFNNLIYL
jgi:hypothetical protein